MQYSDITPRTNAYADMKLLERAELNNILGQFGQDRTLPSKETKNISFRRYERLTATVTPLTEGVTPAGSVLTYTDYSVSLEQYGDFIQITDVIRDTHEDPILNESIDVLGEQAGESVDLLRAAVLKAGTNVLYANGTSRGDVNDVITQDLFRSGERILNAQYAKKMKEIVSASVKISTFPIPQAFCAVCHSDLKPDLERLSDWRDVAEYGNMNGQMNGEMGAYGAFRFCQDNNVLPWPDAGGTAATNATISTTGTDSDVYPILIFGQNAYGIVNLGGKSGVSTYVANPKATESDPLAQRGTVGWKTYNATIILNDAWMLRVETAAKG